MNCRETEPLLGAYLDGELDLVHSLEIEAHLTRCEACTRALRMQEDLSAAVAAAPRFPASPKLRRRLEHRPAGRLRQTAPWLAVAASVAVALLVWRYAPGDTLTTEIVRNHIRSIQADHLLEAASPQAIKPWLAGKLDYTLDVQDLSWRGFTLAGGRVDHLQGKSVAALVYQHGQNVVNVFVWPGPGEPDSVPAIQRAGGFHVVSWRANGMNWRAVSDLDAGELEELPLCPCFLPVNRTLRADSTIRPG